MRPHAGQPRATWLKPPAAGPGWHSLSSPFLSPGPQTASGPVKSQECNRGRKCGPGSSNFTSKGASWFQKLDSLRQKFCPQKDDCPQVPLGVQIVGVCGAQPDASVLPLLCPRGPVQPPPPAGAPTPWSTSLPSSPLHDPP